MKRAKGIITSAIPRLSPTLITNKVTGEIVSWEDYLNESLSPFLDWSLAETQRLYEQDTKKAHELAGNLTGSANSFARQNGYKVDYSTLPRGVKAKSRIAEIVYHKLMSETAAYEKNPNPKKQLHGFSRTVNLGAVNKQMASLEREGNELILTWACWENEYEYRFTLPHYVQSRDITKFSLPTVNAKGFIFSYQESPTPVKNKKIAGLDLGRVEPFTMVVMSPNKAVLAEHKATKQLRATNLKRERILREVRDTRNKAEAREDLGLESEVLREQVRNLRAKAKRLSVSISASAGSQVASIMKRHEVSLLRLEDLSWANGKKYGSKWAHSQAGKNITHATQRAGSRVEKVDPCGTSQHCHACKTKITHNTKTRTVWCGECKSRLDRDYNAAMNIAKKQSFPIMNNGHDGSTFSDSSQSTGQSPKSLVVQTLTTLDL